MDVKFQMCHIQWTDQYSKNAITNPWKRNVWQIISHNLMHHF